MARKQTLLLVLLLASAALLTLLGYARLSSRRDAAEAAARDLAICRDLVQRLSQLKDRPTLAATSQLDSVELTRRIQEAETAAGMSGAVSGITPEQPTRVQGTDYREVNVPVRIERVGLRELIAFAHHLSSVGGGLRVKGIRLAAPGDGSAGAWAAEVRLAYLLYQPEERRGGGPRRSEADGA